MVRKSTKRGMSPFFIINGPIDVPDYSFILAGENEILTAAERILEAVEVLLMTHHVCKIQYSQRMF